MPTTNLNNAEADRILKESRAIIEGSHFVYISGDHGSGWVDKDVIYPDTTKVARLTELLAPAVRAYAPDVVCGPATGGLVISQWLAHHLGILSVFAEHGGAVTTSSELRGDFILKRHYDQLVRGKRVLVVDDIVNTGHSVVQTAAAVRASGGNIVAAAALVNRGNTDADRMGVPEFVFLTEALIPSWSEAACDLCKRDVPVNVDYAHGAEFVEKKEAAVK
jgi:orotate phosphoribosyltransferase